MKRAGNGRSESESRPGGALRFGEGALVALFLITVGGNALLTLRYAEEALLAAGPNTVGEAGKVYFAKLFQDGASISSAGDTAPYYPSFHGWLLHSSVGLIGRLGGAETIDLYYVGRTISVLCTLGALALAALILRRMKIHLLWAAAIGVAFVAVFRVTQHAISYRGDHWILFLSLLTCYLLIRGSRSPCTLAIAAVTPSVAFLIKAPGIGIAGSVWISLLLQREWKRAGLYALGAGLSLLALTGVIRWWSGDSPWLGVTTVTDVPFSLENLLSSLNVPQLWLPLLMPLVLLSRSRLWSPRGERGLSVLTAFWAVSFVSSSVAAIRLGSDAYYFVESFLLGMLICVIWLAQEVKRGGFGANPATVALIAIFCVQGVPSGLSQWVKPARDVALQQTLTFGKDRLALAGQINAAGLRCFSDDPGLNVLLDHPAVIYAALPMLMEESGALPEGTVVAPVKAKAYDLIALTRSKWQFRQVLGGYRRLLEAVKENYEPARTKSAYLLLVPR